MAKEWQKAIDKAGFDAGDLDSAWDALAHRKRFLPKRGLLGGAPNLDRLLKQSFHPDQACVARVIKYGRARELIFNYRSKFTRPWLTPAARRKYGYQVRVRGNDELSIVTVL